MLISVKQTTTSDNLWVAAMLAVARNKVKYEYLRDVSVGVHHVHVLCLHGRGGRHTRVSVTAGVGADVTVGNLEILRRKMIRRVAAQVDRVKAGWLVRRRLQARVVPALGTDGVRAAVGRG